MTTVSTSFGTFTNVSRVETFPSGVIKSFIPRSASTLCTPIGDLIPQYTGNEERKRKLAPVVFYESGNIKNVHLENQTVIHTPLGSYPAEFVSFHEDGSLHRFFPLNGTLSGYWTEEDETRLAEPITIESPIGVLNARVINCNFRSDGSLRSITLWPGEVLRVATPAGIIAVRSGISFYEDGSLESVEPAEPVAVQTSIGSLRVFDPDANGMNGDNNSLVFSIEGEVISLATTLHTLEVVQGESDVQIAPPMRAGLCDDEVLEPGPLRISLGQGKMHIAAGDTQYVYPLDSVKISIKSSFTPFSFTAPACGIGM